MEHRSHFRPFAALAAAMALAAAGAPEAAVLDSGYAPQALPQRVVTLRGLDASRPADVHVMYARIRAAAQAVCGGEPATGRLPGSEQQRCMASSIDAAVARINRSALTAYHQQVTGQPATGAGRG